MQEKISQIQNKSQTNLFKQIITSSKRDFVLTIASTIATSIIVLSFGFCVKNIVDAIGGGAVDILLPILVFLFVAVMLCMFSFFRSYASNSMAEKFCNAKKLWIFEQISRSQIKSIYDIGFEKLTSSIQADFVKIRSAIGTNMPFFIRSSFTFVGSLIILFTISFKIALCSFGSIIVLLLPAFLLKKKLKALSANITPMRSSLDSEVFDSILNIKLVKIFSNEASEISIKQAKINEIFALEKTRLKVRALLIAVAIFSVVVGSTVGIYLGNIAVINAELTAGDLGAFVLYSVMMTAGLAGAGENGVEFFRSFTSWRNILEIHSKLKPENLDCGSKIDKINEISVNEIMFNYDKKENILIPNFTTKTGNPIILNAESGSGKTTFFDILTKFHFVDNGKISINSIDINEISTASIRNKIAYFNQQSAVMDKTLLENLQYSGELNFDKIKQTMHNFNLQSLIERLEEKISNLSLSGGEKTRIGLCSAILKQANVYIFDEPTTGLDSDNSILIYGEINRLVESGKIVFIASHDYELTNYFPNAKIINIVKSS